MDRNRRHLVAMAPVEEGRVEVLLHCYG